MAKLITDEIREKVYLIADKQMRNIDIARILGISEGSVSYIVNFIKRGQDGDIKWLFENRKDHEQLLQWTLRKFLLSQVFENFVDTITEATEEIYTEGTEKSKDEETEESKDDITTLLNQILEQQKITNQFLAKLF